MKEEDKITRAELFSLLNMFMSGLPTRWTKYQTFVTIYTTIILSIIGSTILGINSFNSKNLLLLIVGPFLIISISYIAKNTIIKQSEDIKEYIAMIAKIMFELGLYEDIRMHEPLDGNRLWDNDKSFMLPRWVLGRHKSGKSSEEYISKFGIGSIRQTIYIFNLFMFVGFFLLLAILYLTFARC